MKAVSMTTHPAIPQRARYTLRLAHTIRRNLAATNELGFVGLIANAAAFIVAAPVFLILRVLKAIIETATFGIVTLSVAPTDTPRTGQREPVSVPINR